MKKTKTQILTALLAIALSITLFSLGSISVFAGIPDEYDQHGTPISYWIPIVAEDSLQKLWLEDLPEVSTYNTFIFLDSQLVAYDYVQALCEAYPPDPSIGEQGLTGLYYTYGIQIFVHTGGWTFTNITMQEMGYEQCDYDFTDQETYEWLYGMVGQVAMCGMAILNMDYSLYSFLLHFQNVWQNLCQRRMPIYSIQRDPITLGVGGLWSYIYNLYVSSSAGGGTTGGQAQIIPGE